ncbi:MAG: DUF309 domain-containing protein [Ardenticatenaceae bacterium]|nr:DUF309 domain-containing protein [Anaerolineales bacterium]MCB8920394.1 DUF309 domain-containing protein [Ardenticatenaceae bacterium]MCB8989349.1 DUF309 domain-containing protein [Ardenticatenaceae bacterium]MCB9004504.1 DUF309 domain-containing protein [Ardenticatenaceae bacterium]
MTHEDIRLIVGFVSDLMFATRIEKVADHLGFKVEWIENANKIDSTNLSDLKEPPGEMLHGRNGKLFEKVTAWQPALLLFDLTNQDIPWQTWIPALKTSPATRRIPIMCFGPHVNVALMTEAKRVGADLVLARSRFASDMGTLFEKHARTQDSVALNTACAEPLPELVRTGIELFNQGDYYKCHDALEKAWMADKSMGRDLYRGLLQVGIALYQIQQGNYRGAVKMLLRVRQWLGPLPTICRGVHVAALRENAQKIYEHVHHLGPEHLDAFDWSLVSAIEYETK